MELIRQSIIERRNRLGWSDKILAKKSNVPYIVIRRMLEGSSCLDGYISQIIIVRLIIEQIHLVVKRFFEIGAYFVIEICK